MGLGSGLYPENEALPWSLELIERYEDRWDWAGTFPQRGPALVP